MIIRHLDLFFLPCLIVLNLSIDVQYPYGVTFLTLLVLSFPGFAQVQDPVAAKEYFEQAGEILEATKAEPEAREVYILAAETDTTLVKANFEAGHIIVNTAGTQPAAKYFMRVYRQDPDYRFDIEYWIGKSYQLARDYDKAIRYYNLYKAKLGTKPNYRGKDKPVAAEVDRLTQECRNGK